LVVAKGDSRARMRHQPTALSGNFGPFDHIEARKMFELASKSKRASAQFAIVLLGSRSTTVCQILSAKDFSAIGSIFFFLRSLSTF
jgi:hypothetical protein